MKAMKLKNSRWDELDNFNKETFISYYELDLEFHTNTAKTIRVVYWAFTSMTTVGFGDFAPRSDDERLAGGFILLFGVAIFSYINGNFITVLMEFQALNEDLGEDEQLEMFFYLLKRFNGDKHVNQEMRDRFDEFFKYKWNYDKNMAIDDEAEIALLE